MKKKIVSFLFAFSSFCYGQMKNERYLIDKPASMVISSLNFKNQTEITGILSSGETVILQKKYLKIILTIRANGDSEVLKEIDDKVGEKNIDEIPFLELFEYDFNADGKKELIVVTSPNSDSFSTLEVFKHNAQLVKKVGNFSLGVTATFDKNLMSIYSGANEAHINFLYLENQFWKLNWHNPKGEEE